MINSIIPESPESNESFRDILSQHEKGRSRKSRDGGRGLEGTVIAVFGESVVLDIGFKTEGILPLAAFQSSGLTVSPGDKLPVSVKGREAGGYYELSLGKITRPKDWSSLEKAYAEKSAVIGTVTGVVKGGLSVDVGVRAFLPASRSGVRDAAEMAKMVGQEVRCRVIKLDVADEDVVVDCRAVAEDEERAAKDRRYSEVAEGDTINGVISRLADYGAFVDIGGVDALLHVSDIAWSRVNNPADVLSVGQQIEVKVLKVDPAKRRISLGLKQLQAHPWDLAVEKFLVGERVRGTVTRLAEFGAFVELEPGIEGLIHISELSWSKRVRNPGDIVKPGETVEAVILKVSPVERRISLGLKQALGDPWAEVPQRFAVGSVIEGTVTSLTNFGAFVQVAEGVEGMVPIGDITAEKRLRHPQDALKVGQTVKAQVIEIDTEKRLLRLGMKQLVPTGVDEYMAEHKEGDVVTGRMTEVTRGVARVQLAEGVQGTCRMPVEAVAEEKPQEEAKADLTSLSSMLNARWKVGPSGGEVPTEAVRAGQVHSFRIARLDPAAKIIELELAQ